MPHAGPLHVIEALHDALPAQAPAIEPREQLPFPSHWSGWVVPPVAPPVQSTVPVLHEVPEGYCKQSPVPAAQAPLVPHELAPWSVHALAQQKPPPQVAPFEHWSLLAHAAPAPPFGWHVPAPTPSQ